MIRKVEGLVLKKILYKERNIIAHLLLRSGKKISIIFYGGAAGKVSKNSSILEVGHMIKVELQVTRSTSDMYRAKEWSLIWNSSHIRENFRSFYSMCLMLEVIEKISGEDYLYDEHRDHDKDSEGYFNVLSNSLFYMNDQVKNNNFNNHRSLLVFLTKLSIYQGIFPIRDTCVLSGETITENDSMGLVFEDGGFALSHYSGEGHLRHGGTSYSQKELWRGLGIIGSHQFNELGQFEIESDENVRLFFNYLCYHLHYFESDFKSFSMCINK